MSEEPPYLRASSFVSTGTLREPTAAERFPDCVDCAEQNKTGHGYVLCAKHYAEVHPPKIHTEAELREAVALARLSEAEWWSSNMMPWPQDEAVERIDAIKADIRIFGRARSDYQDAQGA